MSDIPAELSLDVTSALAAVDRVEAALVAAADAFQQSIATALGSLDVAPTTIPVDVDAGAVSTDISAAVDAADTSVDVNTDASGLTSDISSAVDAADTTVSVGVEADTEAAKAAIDDLSGTTVEVGVEADTTQATQGFEDLASSTKGAVSGATDVGVAMRGADIAAQGLSGNLQGVTAGLATVNPELKVAAIAFGTVSLAGKTLVDNAIDSVSSLQRFNLVLGESAARVRQIQVGGLNEDLGTLANRLGADDESLQNATSRFFSFGIANGTARSAVEQTTQQIDALAARAVALNPALVDVGDTVTRLTQALATGRNTADFGLSLSSAAVTAEALRENVGKTSDELTRYDRAAAGATLATQALGNSLSTDVNAGAQNVAIQFRAVGQEFQNVLESAGAPILQPILDLLKALEPAAAPLAQAFASILETAVPFATALTELIVPALETLEPVLNAVGKAGGFLAGVFKFGLELTGIPETVRIAGFAVHTLQNQFGDAGDAAIAAAGQVAQAFSSIGTSVEAGVAGAGNTLAAFGTTVTGVLTERDKLAEKFQAGLPSIGDAFEVQAARVGTASKAIAKASTDLIDAAKKLEDRFSAGLPSVSDAFKQGVSPEDLAKAQTTLEAFIQGVEGVSKSAADAAQAVIDKAQTEGGTGLAGFLQQLREQTQQITAFQASLATLRARGALDLAGAFADKGIQSAADAAEAAGLSQTDLAAAEATVEQAKTVKSDAVASMGLFADELVATFGPKGAEAGTVFGEGLVANLASPDIIAKARAEAAKLAEAASSGASGGASAAPQQQTLAGFLAALKSQSGDIQKFQADLDKISQEGGTVLADTLREQGIKAAQAADQAAGLAPAQLAVAEQAVRDAQTILSQAETDNQAAADRLQAFTAEVARKASEAFNTNLNFNVGTALGEIPGQITAAAPQIVSAAATLGTAAGTQFGTALTTAVTTALAGGALAGLFAGGAITLGQVTLGTPVAAANASFGQPTPEVAAQTGTVVNVDNINVTPPADSNADEQAAAIARQLQYAIVGAR